jgi:hypothetical protein
MQSKVYCLFATITSLGWERSPITSGVGDGFMEGKFVVDEDEFVVIGLSVGGSMEA